MSITSIARAALRSLSPYSAAEQVDDTIRLNANESAWTNNASSFARPLNRYPEIRPAGLVATLADHYGVPAGQLLVTRGTSEAIDLLIRCFCSEGTDNIVTTSPTFSMYSHYAGIQGAELRSVACSEDDDFAVDAGELLSRCDDNTKLVFLCSPNNPTGTLVARDTLIEVLQQREGRSAVVVDEAYIEFSPGQSCLDLIARFDNLVVLRTLSKALAFAGARCGVVIGPADVIGMLNAVQAPYALATPVVECVSQALTPAALQAAREQIEAAIAERERLVAALAEFSFVRKIWPSAANFLFIRLDSAQEVLEQAREDRILLRWFGGDLADFVRITIGSRTENDRLIESLGKLVED